MDFQRRFLAFIVMLAFCLAVLPQIPAYSATAKKKTAAKKTTKKKSSAKKKKSTKKRKTKKRKYKRTYVKDDVFRHPSKASQQLPVIPVPTGEYKKVAPAASSRSASDSSYSWMNIAPKGMILLGNGGSALGLGAEGYFSISREIDILADLSLFFNQGATMTCIGGGARYKFEEISGFIPYAGGELMYGMLGPSGIGGTSVSGIGFSGFGGIDYPIGGSGAAFGQLKYTILNYSTSVGGITASGNSGGLSVEGGYRFYL